MDRALIIGKVMIDKDLTASDAITLAQWQQRSLGVRFKESFARLWEYGS